MTHSNYHTHHRLCRHAKGTTIDYVQKAIELGFKTLGMSDHVPSDLLPDTMRMTHSDVDAYIQDVRAVQEAHQDTLAVYLGMECEFLDPDPAYYERFLTHVDYLILGQHYVKEARGFQSAFALSTDAHILEYGRTVENAIKSGYFSLVAHPDLYMCGIDTFNEAAKETALRIIKSAVENDIPLEFNANGIRRGIKKTSQGMRYPYPRMEFWQIAKSYPVNVILSSDAHHPNKLYDDAMKEAEQLIEQFELKRIHTLNMKHLKNRV